MSFSSNEPLIIPIGKQLETNYDVHELPGEVDFMSDCPPTLSSSVTECSSAMPHASSQAANVLHSKCFLQGLRL